MNRIVAALLVPPAAVTRYGCATCTAAPIGVFWLASLVSLVYGLLGGRLGGVEGTEYVLIGLGVVMWLIAAVWTLLVIRGVDQDLSQGREGSLDRRVVPKVDEPDPFKELKGH